MSELLINEVKLVERYKQANPLMEAMLEHGGYYYMAGTLMLHMKDPVSGLNMTAIDILPIDDYASEIIRKGQYLASQLYVTNKEPTCCFQSLAQDNIEKYEKIYVRLLNNGPI